VLFVRILIVDDFEPFRRYLRSFLQPRVGLQLVGEASDGLEAVQKAEELQPDLILLDIGLPKLDGLEAARQILALAPAAKILFISQDTSSDVVEESFRLGGQGYVLKLRAGSDLQPAMEAVLRGERFVSQGLEYSLDTDCHYRHLVHFYSDDSDFLETSTRFIADALKAGKTVIVALTPAHHEGLVQGLNGEGIDVDRAILQGTYAAFEAYEMISKIVSNGGAGSHLILEMFCGFVESAAKTTGTKRPDVAILGECASLLHAQGNLNGAISLEKIGVELASMGINKNLDILCPYAMSAFRGGETDPAFSSICAEHTAVHSG
jgi:DNA-binding NarL/FixJ family response regulator